MLALKSFRDTHEGAADLLNWAALCDDGIVQCKDGSLLVGWYYDGPDAQGASDQDQNTVAFNMNKALARLGGGWTIWAEACRVPVQDYPEPEESFFPDPVSRLVDAERRANFTAPDRHYKTLHAIVLQYTPPVRRKTRLQDMIYDDDTDIKVAPVNRILDHVKKVADELEDSLGSYVKMQRMPSYVVDDEFGRHFRDELVNFLHYAWTGQSIEIDLPPTGCYLDSAIGGQDLWAGDTPRLGDLFTAAVTVDAFPAASSPGLLNLLDQLDIPYRWSTRFIFTDHQEARTEINKIRKEWQQQVRGFVSQIFQKGDGGKVDQDALLMVKQADDTSAEANSGLVTFGYYTLVILLRDADRHILNENARAVVKAVNRMNFTARLEGVNTMEAMLGAMPGHSLPNVRRPLIHTEHLSHLLPLSSAWMGRATNPCPFYPPNSPPLLYAATDGSTPLRLSLHVDDVGNTIVFGPIGAGKTVLLATVAMQALRYPGATVWWFDYKRGGLATIKAMGGRHYDVVQDRMAFAPLSQLGALDDMLWAEDYISLCFELQMKRAPNSEQREHIHRAMVALSQDMPGTRSMSHFVMHVQDTEVREALRYYTMDGTMGGMLDAEEDSIAVQKHMCFELEDLLTLSAQTSIPVLMYLFRRFQKALNGQPMYLILDELATLLTNPVILKRLPELIRITRSKNGAIVMATQLLSDAHKSGLLDVLLENCATKIFLPNPAADTPGPDNVMGPYDYYIMMGLNDRQISLIKNATRKRDYYIVQDGLDGGSRMFSLELGPVALAFSGATSKPDIARIRELEREHGTDWPFRWLDQKGIDYEHLLPT